MIICPSLIIRYYEIYYLEAGERFHMVEDQLYKMEAGEFMIFPPYVMHHSYGEENMPFKKYCCIFHRRKYCGHLYFLN